MFTVLLVIVEVASGWVASAWGLKESLLVLAIASAPVAVVLLLLWSKEVDASRASGEQVESAPCPRE